jgi:hypothetical protein
LVGWLVANQYTFTLKMATAVFAETLDNLQHLTSVITLTIKVTHLTPAVKT